ncbi:response regulator receiver protein [Candidatus Scalindua japonica]|uniref:Response regulator receiver protein n=1 Tax=Candidatus Scalindua japonica TaxID=1284222 RepID=A0A286TUD4_9BACT|nr:response regulator [Candidatus Scalindua japonica]GAX59502.1 response regulator receiver protein [Candidatus Scalindua japonica]
MSKKKILAVDDEPNLTHSLRRTLTATGKYEVREENSGACAYKSALEFQPDIIILDVMMPGIGGGAIAEKIQDNDNLKHIPIVFLTGILEQQEVESTGSNISCHTFLAKPVNPDDLITCIEKKLGK